MSKSQQNFHVFLYPCDHYGNPDLLREIIKREKVDALFLITDPRYFEWVFAMEHEIRANIPIAYLNIWDDLPAPMYNRDFYDYSSYDNRRWAAHSGSDSDDLYIFFGYSRGLLEIQALHTS